MNTKREDGQPEQEKRIVPISWPELLFSTAKGMMCGVVLAVVAMGLNDTIIDLWRAMGFKLMVYSDLIYHAILTGLTLTAVFYSIWRATENKN